MPLYDYECETCGTEREKFARMADRREQRCDTCDGPLTLIARPTPRYVPFQSYFDIGLGVEITGRDHHRRVMRDTNCVQRDPPRPGDRSARLDKIRDAKREEARRKA